MTLPLRQFHLVLFAAFVVAIGALDKDNIHTPGIYVDRILQGAAFEKRIEQRTVRSLEGAA